MKTELSLDAINASIQSDLRIVEDKILEILATPNELSSEVIRYFFRSKGKFLRPSLCLFGASFGDQAVQATIQMAAALEIFHSATLIHDDIIDSSYLRRNVPTINARWGPQIAVLVGDYLHDKAIGAVFGTKNDRAISVFLETAGIVCDGEILELNEKNNFQLREDQYFQVIEKKTASLLSCCLETGAILAGLEIDQVLALKRFGLYFGMAFQIIDDCLDFVGKENEFGKTLGADLSQGVLTLPLIRLISLVDERTKQEIFHLVKSAHAHERFERLVRYLEECEALHYATEKAREFTDQARLELAGLPDRPARQSLALFLDYILERNR